MMIIKIYLFLLLETILEKKENLKLRFLSGFPMENQNYSDPQEKEVLLLD
jgi:hypothetical protein